MESFSKEIEAQRTVVRNTMKTRINATLATLIFISISTIFVNLLIHFRLLRSAIKPIIKLSCCVKNYTRYNFSKEIPEYHKRDELFELLQNVDLMRSELSNSISSLKLKVNYDGLTGLYNRRYFNEFFAKEWKIAKENGEVFSLILFDIDYYKNYNDSYGHLAGDDCLKMIAQCLDVYNEDSWSFVARYGGEEFAVLLRKRNELEAQMVAEKIRKAILALEIPHKASPVHEFVTVSMGVAATMPKGSMMPNELISMADKALYYAKQNGRNKVTLYSGEKGFISPAVM